MEAGQRFEAVGESKTHPVSNIGENVLSIPSIKLSSSTSSSASDSPPDDSFELTANVGSKFLDGTIDPLKNDEVYVAGHQEPGFKLINDGMEARPMSDFSNAAKTSNHSLSQSSSSASESSLHDHIPNDSASPSNAWPMDAKVQPPKPDKDNDTKFMELDSNETFTCIEPALVNSSTSNLGMQPGSELGEADAVVSHKNLRTSSSTSSCSSSDFESESEPKSLFQASASTINNSFTKNSGAPSLEKDTMSVSDVSDDDIPISSMPNNGQSPTVPTHTIELSTGSESATQSPPAQVMERPDDPTSPSYRIPSRVFTRTKSTAPMEWSAASNESLFSIHMGNMSFTREQLCWLGKSGELCRPGESAMSPLIELSSNQPPLIINKPCNKGPKGNHQDGMVTEATAAETMREVIRENSENQHKNSSTLTESSSQSASLSHQSEGSTKSFQFPILSGDGGKSISLKVDDEKPKQQTQPESPRSPSNPQTPKEACAGESPKETTPNMGTKKWFSCFSCCPFCS